MNRRCQKRFWRFYCF